MAADPNWSPLEDLPFVPLNSEQITIAASGAVAHLAWAQAKTIYHARRVEGQWTSPVKVAGGEQPSLVATADGKLNCAFAHSFLGNRDIYISSFAGDKWSLPERVSHTTGASSDPALCAGAGGALHLAWADDTPGYSIIYYATQASGAWTIGPIPNGKGSKPTIASHGADMYVGWQDRLASSERGAFDVFAAVKRRDEWTLPAMVSDTRESHSLLPRIGVTPQGRCDLVWQEERGEVYVIRHSDLWPEGWAEPVDVSDPAVDARLGYTLPNRWGLFQFVWSEGSVLKHRVRPGEPQAPWKTAENACENCAGLSELAAAISDSGELHVVLTRYINGGQRKVQYLRRRAIERQKVHLPVISN